MRTVKYSWLCLMLAASILVTAPAVMAQNTSGQSSDQKSKKDSKKKKSGDSSKKSKSATATATATPADAAESGKSEEPAKVKSSSPAQPGPTPIETKKKRGSKKGATPTPAEIDPNAKTNPAPEPTSIPTPAPEPMDAVSKIKSSLDSAPPGTSPEPKNARETEEARRRRKMLKGTPVGETIPVLPPEGQPRAKNVKETNFDKTSRETEFNAKRTPPETDNSPAARAAKVTPAQVVMPQRPGVDPADRQQMVKKNQDSIRKIRANAKSKKNMKAEDVNRSVRGYEKLVAKGVPPEQAYEVVEKTSDSGRRDKNFDNTIDSLITKLGPGTSGASSVKNASSGLGADFGEIVMALLQQVLAQPAEELAPESADRDALDVPPVDPDNREAVNARPTPFVDSPEDVATPTSGAIRSRKDLSPGREPSKGKLR